MQQELPFGLVLGWNQIENVNCPVFVFNYRLYKNSPCPIPEEIVSEATMVFKTGGIGIVKKPDSDPFAFIYSGILDRLTKDELLAALHHEDGHFIHRDLHDIELEEGKKKIIINADEEIRADKNALKYSTKSALKSLVHKLVQYHIEKSILFEAFGFQGFIDESKSGKFLRLYTSLVAFLIVRTDKVIRQRFKAINAS